jgi:hypothetical protein
MTFENGLIYLIGAITIFYIRWVYVYYKNDERKRKKEERELLRPKKKNAKMNPKDEYQPGFFNMHLRNWKLLAGGLVLVVIGILLNPTIINWQFHTGYWWFFAVVGVLLLTFCYN